MIKKTINTFIFSTFLIATMLSASHLEAGGWGKTDKQIENEGILWNEVYFDMNGLFFSAFIPNYSNAMMRNGMITFNGNTGDGLYLITTSFNPGFTPPKTIEQFVRLIQDANPQYKITVADAKRVGAKYVLDMTPMHQEDSFWRFIATRDRLIKMGTGDKNENRRSQFFESLVIR